MRRFRLRRRSQADNDGPQAPQATAPVPSPPKRDTKANKPSPPPVPKPSKPPHGLNPRQASFVDHYVIHKNATEAARLAGYSKKTAMEQGGRLFRNVRIRAEIDRRLSALAGRLEITAERINLELARIGFANMNRYMKPGPDGEPMLDFSELSEDDTAALQEVTVEEFTDGRSDKREVRRVKFKLGDKRAALETLGRSLGMFVEKHDHKHQHQHTLMGQMLQEIDEESRAKTIEHDPAK